MLVLSTDLIRPWDKHPMVRDELNRTGVFVPELDSVMLINVDPFHDAIRGMMAREDLLQRPRNDSALSPLHANLAAFVLDFHIFVLGEVQSDLLLADFLKDTRLVEGRAYYVLHRTGHRVVDDDVLFPGQGGAFVDPADHGLAGAEPLDGGPVDDTPG